MGPLGRHKGREPIRTVSAKETESAPQSMGQRDSVQGATALRRALLPLQVCHLPREAEDLLGLALSCTVRDTKQV